jgi:hypothetical protein
VVLGRAQVREAAHAAFGQCVAHVAAKGLHPLGDDLADLHLDQEMRAAAQPGDRLFVGDEPLQIYLYAGVPPASRFIYWNAPNPNAIAERAAAVEREPRFFFLPRVAEQQRQAMRAERPGEPDPLEQRYEPWVTSPVGIVYRRRPAE